MPSFVEYFVIFVMVIIVILYVKQYYGEIAYVKSKSDDRLYLVRKLPDMNDAANYLADITGKCTKLVNHLVRKYPDNPDVKRLRDNFDPNNVSEGSSENGYTSYSVNKGEKIILCIRQKEDNSFVDKNIVMYVTIHELAHLATKEVGHTPTFWENFKFLLNEAVEIGVYKKVDYNRQPVKYCGIKITSSVI